MKVCISSGHGKHVRGAAGNPGLDEVDEARLVVECSAGELERRHITVYTFHDNNSTTQDQNLNTLVSWHNSHQRDLDISVHFNAYDAAGRLSILLGNTDQTIYYRHTSHSFQSIGAGTTFATIDSTGVSAVGYACRIGLAGGYRTTRFNIDWTGSVAGLYVDNTFLGAFAYTSDYRIKKNVKDAGPALDEVRRWRTITYTGADHGIFEANEHVRHSFIAHELQAVSPDCVIGEKDGEQLQSLDMLPIVVRLAKAVQELLARVEKLEAR